MGMYRVLHVNVNKSYISTFMVTRNSRIANARSLKVKYFPGASMFYMFLMWVRERGGGGRDRQAGQTGQNVLFNSAVTC